MKKTTLAGVIGLAFLSACSTSERYPGWQYVRIEYTKPDRKCEYKIQEVCGRDMSYCMNWYKQRATKYGANTVVIANSVFTTESKSVAVIGPTGGAGGSRSAG